MGAQPHSLKGDPGLKEKLQELRRTDNWTNLYYLARTYLFLAAAVGGAVWFHLYRRGAGLSPWWDVPVALLAVLLVGAAQHQLTGLAHEAAHHTLLRHRLLNDLVSDWLCMFPLFSSTYHYRLQHLAHHQFVNDPLRDPDVSQLQASGHWLDFPVGKARYLLTLLRQLSPLRLARYIRIRARYNMVPTDKNPYLTAGARLSKVPVRAGLVYIATLVLLLTALVRHGDAVLLAALPAVLWVLGMIFFALLPDRMYHRTRVRPVVSGKAMTLMRLSYFTIVFGALAWATWRTGEWAAVYYLLLWVVPIFTSFSFFMILRQIVQHGNGGRGWLTNTRVFSVNPLIRFAVFPAGQDYHLPHHLYVSVPHYRLRQLHELLLQYPEYREQATVVEGYFLPRHRPPTRPTVLDVLGPEHAPRRPADVHIENSVLDGEEVDEREAILREGEAEAGRARAEAPPAGERRA